MAESTPAVDPVRRTEILDQVIRGRRTRKVHAGVADPAAFEARLRTALEVAGHAPFHFPRTDEVAEPWRFHVFVGEALRAYQQRLTDAELLYGKLPKIFDATGAVVQATWLPETDPERADRDWEHAAAAAAAVQNLLLAAEARGMASYWCSAPNLGSAQAFALGGIPADQRFLGTLFFGDPLSPEAEAKIGWSGKMHTRRSAAESWTRWA